MYKIITINNKKNLFISDLHILHKNIIKYEEYSRNIINKKLNLNRQNFLQYNIDFLNKILDLILKIKKEKNIYKVYNLGDFIFNLNEQKINNLINNGLNIENIKKINFIFILGNHDLILKKNKVEFEKTVYLLNKVGINNVKFYDLIRNNKYTYIITHHPVIYNVNNFYKGFWKEKNNEIFKIIKDDSNKIINIHGHTHSKSIIENDRIKGISYINTCIDNLVL